MRRTLLILGAWTSLAAAAAAQQLPQLQPLRQQPAAQPADQPAAQPAAGQQAAPTPTTVREEASYFVGISLAKQLLGEGMKVDPAWLYRGLVETFNGQKPVVNEADLIAATKAFEEEMAKQQAERDRVLGEQNKKQGVEFLARNKTQPGVVTLPSGLQYQIVKAGNGPKPKATDVVRVHYRGVLLDGTEFDSSYSGDPAEFAVGGVIPGWTEALQLMPTGSQWRLFVPAALAYADERRGPDIGPNSTLVFDVELLAIIGSVGSTPQP